MKYFKWTILPLLGFAMLACKQNEKAETTDPMKSDSIVVDSTQTALPVGDTPENSLDWDGTYEATLPCADCEGIKTVLVINQDKTFALNQEYIGKGEKIEDKGTFEWNTEGTKITLNGKDNKSEYKVGEDRLIQLDTEGNEITGPTKDLYIFMKK